MPRFRPCEGSDRRFVVEPLEHRVLLAAQAPVLVRDIFTGPAGADSKSVAAVGGTVYFVFDDNQTGPELWRSDGTAAGTALVKDIVPGTPGANPSFLTPGGGGGALYFVAHPDSQHLQVWVTDGSEAGTRPLVSFASGTSPTGIFGMAAVGDTLYFVESHYYPDQQARLCTLWRSDGTASGTVPVKTFTPAYSTIGNLTVMGGVLYFTTLGNSSQNRLWRSDGTTANTVPVTDRALQVYHPFESLDYRPVPFAVAGNNLFFVANDGIHGYELWKSDGTDSGTSMVADVYPGVRDGVPDDQVLAAAGDVVIFAGTDPTHGLEPWRSDGTAEGTWLLKDIDPTASSSPGALAAVNGKVYFNASGPAGGVWATDGTVDGTQRLTDAAANSFNLVGKTAFVAVNGKTLFSASTPANGGELWSSDGTPAGTSPFTDLNPGAAGAGVTRLISTGNVGFFTGTDGTMPLGLFRTDGTSAGTTLVRGLDTPTLGSMTVNAVGPAQTAVLRDPQSGPTLVFAASSVGTGSELWRSDGSAGGTQLVRDINPGSPGSNPAAFTSVGNLVFFTAADGAGNELWRTDGTEVGTYRLADINPGAASSNPAGLTAVGNTLFFTATDPVHGAELWKSDGTPQGTVLVKDIQPGPAGSVPSQATGPAVGLNGVLLFIANDGTAPNALWRSDGTAAGTYMVKRINQVLTYRANFTISRGVLYFSTDDWGDAGHVEQLWRSDGTAAGTYKVLDVGPGIYGQNILNMVDVAGTLYFTFETAAAGRELWTSDGTAAGTKMVTDLNPGPDTSWPSNLTSVGGRLFFRAYRAGVGDGLWTSDGTAAGTVRVKDTNPNGWDVVDNSGNSSTAAWMTDAYGTLYFAATDGVNGMELWQSDGTEAGTRMLDVAPGNFGPSPANITVAGDTLYFSAADRAHGRELWKLALDPPGLTASADAAYTLSGAAGQKVLSVSAGTIALAADLSQMYPNLSVQASNGASILFNATQHLAGLTLSGGATATLAGVGASRTAASHRVLVVGTLNIDAASGSRLDLADNDLVFKGGGALGLAAVQSLISSGYAKDAWNGGGIVTSTAAGKTNNALGYALNDGSVLKAKTTFGPNNEPVGPTDVLVKYTWEGDSNLDGVVSFDDYFYIDSKYPKNSGSTWVTGDFDFNGVTSFDDYFYIDSNYPRNTPL